jgi:hypothetical protein
MTSRPRGIALVADASSGIGSIDVDRLAQRGCGLVPAERDIERLGGIRIRPRAEIGVAGRPPGTRIKLEAAAQSRAPSEWRKTIHEMEEPS